jgi:hypothetical protein
MRLACRACVHPLRAAGSAPKEHRVRWQRLVVVAGACAVLGTGARVLHTRDDDPCGSWAEAPRALDLASSEHRRHLADDLTTVDRKAREFSASVARRPLLSDSIDARAGALTAPARARSWCAAVLTDRVAAAHAVSPAHLRRFALVTRQAGDTTRETGSPARE